MKPVILVLLLLAEKQLPILQSGLRQAQQVAPK
jgi:hypothetical protein